jgi:hypothetical protein
MKRDEAFTRLAVVRDELEAARGAIAYAQRQMQLNLEAARHFPYPLKPSHLRDSGRNLDKTYLLRLFAEFEEILRDYLAVVRPSPRRRRTRMEHLMNRVSGICRMPWDILQNAHEVRAYRNEVVHLGERSERLSFTDCKSRLGRYISFLPANW